MRKIMKCLTVSMLATALMVPGLVSAADMKTKVDYSKVTVVQKNGESWVPLRQVADSLGYSVKWNKMGITLTMKMMMDEDMDKEMDKEMNGMEMKPKPYTITLMPGSKTLMIGMDKVMLEDAPIVMKYTTYVTKAFIETYLANPMMESK